MYGARLPEGNAVLAVCDEFNAQPAAARRCSGGRGMKRPSNETTVNLLALAAIAALGVWLLFATEWVDVWRPTPPRGEAARDDHYAIKQIVGKLGAKVSSPDNLDRLPPPGATLVLESNQWDFLPGRSEQLREWVEGQGGHLVLPSFFTTGASIEWLPLRQKKRAKGAALSCPAPGSANDGERDEEDDEDDEREEVKPARRRPRARARPTRCSSARKTTRAINARRSPSASAAMPKRSRCAAIASARASG